MNKQIIKPDLSTKGYIGNCLNYARRMFNQPAKYPTAWSNWEAINQHKDRNLPKDVSILMWYSYFMGKENYGHVTVNVPGKGIYSSPWKQGQDFAVLKSIEEVERIYHCKYVGWSEYVEDTRVAIADGNATVDNMVNKGDITNLFQWLLGRKPDSKSFEMVGQRWPVVVKHIVMSKEYQDRQKKINSDSKYQDLVNKLKGLIGK